MTLIWVIGYLYTAVGFSIGGVIAWVLKGFQKKIDIIYSICAGLTLGLISFEIAPEAIVLGNWLTFILGFIVGVILFKILHKTLAIFIGATKNHVKNFSLQTGILLMLSIAIHNLPIGIVLGANQDSTVKTSLLQTILLHNIPEGIIVFTPLFIAGLGLWSWFFISLIVSLPVGIGAYIGSSIGIGSPMFWSFSISLAVGTIYMVTVKEVLLESMKESPNVLIIAIISFGVIGGFLFLI
ncbi:ZIP family metal transporter [Viridibacillus sp. YIM B01967]|uniref:ZIP family metal transporter n=1 Tax=Viridibacillus soli TaxID=2798301 RepID=A0ABS1H797_9BACL|nr:ZIP family metal transporter [Viridibacillus soli]MBK3495281.1 ZIP family metal transporter [Viridibacillus soli]